MKFSDIKDLNKEALTKQKTDLKAQLFEMKMKHSLGQLSNTDEIRRVRRNIARYNTALAAAKA